MSKNEFLAELEYRLEIASISSAQEVVSFYDESISDRIDAGMDEEAAVAQVGSVDDIVREVKMNLPMKEVVTGRIKESHESAKKNGMGWLWITLAIVGCPVWVPLTIAAVVLVFAVYIVLCSLVFALFVTLLSLAFAAIACFVSAISVFTGAVTVPAAIGLVGGGSILAGLVMLCWQPVVFALRGLIRIIGGVFRGIKKLFV